MAAALKQLSDALAVDGDELAQRDFNLHLEHGALVLRRKVEPVAGVTFDPDCGRFRIHKYVTGGDTQDHEDCALEAWRVCLFTEEMSPDRARLETDRYA